MSNARPVQYKAGLIAGKPKIGMVCARAIDQSPIGSEKFPSRPGHLIRARAAASVGTSLPLDL